MWNASSEGSCESMLLLLLSLLLSSTGGEIVCGDDDDDYDTSSLIDICRCTNNLRAPAPLSVPMISRLLLLTVEISASATAGNFIVRSKASIPFDNIIFLPATDNSICSFYACSHFLDVVSTYCWKACTTAIVFFSMKLEISFCNVCFVYTQTSEASRRRRRRRTPDHNFEATSNQP